MVQDLSFSGDEAFEFVNPGFPMTVAGESFEYVRIRYTPGEEREAFGRYRFELDNGDEIEGTLFAETGTATRVVETFEPEDDQNKKLDVLVQVDVASSTNNYTKYTRDQVPVELESLRTTLEGLGIDYHIGFITTQGGFSREGWPFPAPRGERDGYPPPEYPFGLLRFPARDRRTRWRLSAILTLEPSERKRGEGLLRAIHRCR